jgi:hypothetical protein
MITNEMSARKSAAAQESPHQSPIEKQNVSASNEQFAPLIVYEFAPLNTRECYDAKRAPFHASHLVPSFRSQECLHEFACLEFALGYN